ncbi:hypothetical protein OEZ85_008723 [Tetradesmus obliquus]|uniref:Uncharacterized protein n=1 Tax=Tetradesmus obliquus TaxID=3088 RepID=A0ABY8TND1_TETOB|nr:hypothetical protein OEZ85_008723 [Tetradesmus obliquus]
MAAVLDTWQVLGAPAAHKAAAASAEQQPGHQQQSPAVCMPLWQQLQPGKANSIAAYTGIPVRVTAADPSSSRSMPGTNQQQQHAPAVTCSADLDWQGSAAEARLVAGLGLTQAVERALAQMEKDAAGPAAAAAVPASGRAVR